MCLRKAGFKYSVTDDEVIMEVIQKVNANLNWYGKVIGAKSKGIYNIQLDRLMTIAERIHAGKRQGPCNFL